MRLPLCGMLVGTGSRVVVVDCVLQIVALGE
jgi:hypothetical protein